jgi:hypothetical protein
MWVLGRTRLIVKGNDLRLAYRGVWTSQKEADADWRPLLDRPDLSRKVSVSRIVSTFVRGSIGAGTGEHSQARVRS